MARPSRPLALEVAQPPAWKRHGRGSGPSIGTALKTRDEREATISGNPGAVGTGSGTTVGTGSGTAVGSRSGTIAGAGSGTAVGTGSGMSVGAGRGTGVGSTQTSLTHAPGAAQSRALEVARPSRPLALGVRTCRCPPKRPEHEERRRRQRRKRPTRGSGTAVGTRSDKAVEAGTVALEVARTPAQYWK